MPSHLWFPAYAVKSCECVCAPFSMFKLNWRISLNEDSVVSLVCTTPVIYYSTFIIIINLRVWVFKWSWIWCYCCLFSCYCFQRKQLHSHYLHLKICDSYKVNTMFRFPVKLILKLTTFDGCVSFDKLHNLYVHLCSIDGMTIVVSIVFITLNMGSIACIGNVSHIENCLLSSVDNVIVLKWNADLTRHIVNTINASSSWNVFFCHILLYLPKITIIR